MGRADEPANEAFQTKVRQFYTKGSAELRHGAGRSTGMSGTRPKAPTKTLTGSRRCGNSTLSVDMAKHGYANIVSESLVFEVSTSIEELLNRGAAGTMDALMAEKGSVWDPSETVRSNVQAEIDGVVWLLKPHTGVFLYLTWMQPHFRRPYIERPERWRVETRTMGEAFHYFLYIAKML
ncbi:hypothetical protein L7F22_023063 [Adiantum nelumboides]|nr:hypothetical protein [Adiantum nelumboides]